MNRGTSSRNLGDLKISPLKSDLMESAGVESAEAVIAILNQCSAKFLLPLLMKCFRIIETCKIPEIIYIEQDIALVP